MARRTRDPEQTPELTGSDARVEEAESGSAGNGADPFGADLSGTSADQRALQPEPKARDIRPDHVERHPAAPPPEEEPEPPAPTAQPTEWPDSDASRLP
ncbi:MAG: hypothetical protein RL653_4388 [Pseudomonadota bacterium]|jgi:hypothetical protein